MTLHFYTSYEIPRIRYISQFLFEEILGFSVHYLESPIIPDGNQLYVHYGRERQSDQEVLLPVHRFMLTEFADLSEVPVNVEEDNNLPFFFKTVSQNDGDLSFDLLSMAFYLISRVEEYNASALDEHGRFPVEQSLAYQHQFLGQPILDQWGHRLYTILQRKCPRLPNRSISYKFQPTIDVDFAWCYSNKGWQRNLGGLLRDATQLNHLAVVERLAVLTGRQEDPFYTFDYIKTVHGGTTSPVYFFLVAQRPGPFDKNISPGNASMKKLIEDIAETYEIGLHPSYASNDQTDLLKEEKKALEALVAYPVVNSRQHFLRLKLPETYRQLIASGIQKDYTMGYAGATGFRASTAYPFYWYDLEKEEATTLRIYPFQIMDVTLKNYLSLSPQEAVTHSAQIVDAIRATGGTFISIWHNSSFSSQMGWQNWGVVYEKLVALAT